MWFDPAALGKLQPYHPATSATSATFAESGTANDGESQKSQESQALQDSELANFAPIAGTGDTAAITSWGWLLHFPDRDPVQVFTSPESPHALVLRDFPDAIAAEPVNPTRSQPTAPMTAGDEMAIRAWLALIEETDPATIAEVISECQRDADARDYFIGRAAELPKPDSFPDDRRTCAQCTNLRQRVCTIAKPERGALVVANRGYQPDPARPLRCEGYAPMATEPDQRAGAERWPGQIQKGGE